MPETPEMVELKALIKQASDKINEFGTQDLISKEAAIKMIEDAITEKVPAMMEARKADFTPPGPQADFFLSKTWKRCGGSLDKMMLMSTKDPTICDLQRLSDDVLMLGAIKGYLEGVPYSIAVKQLNMWQVLNEEISDFRKALDTSGDADWVPTGMSATMIDEIRLMLKVSALHMTIPMPTNPYELPIKTGHSTAYLASEAASDNPTELKKSQLNTSKTTFDAVAIAVAQPFSYEFDEDSIVPVLPAVRADAVRALADAQENATINGDTTSTHLDTGETVAVDDQRRAFNGYRDLTQAAVKSDISAATTAAILGIRQDMGKTGVVPTNLAWVVSINAYLTMIGLTECITVDKYGPSATIQSGELAKFLGSPVIVSEHVRTDLNGSGIFDNTTTTKTMVLAVYTPGWAYGERRGVTIEAVRNPLTQQNILVATRRLDFKPLVDETANYISGFGHNLAS